MTNKTKFALLVIFLIAVGVRLGIIIHTIDSAPVYGSATYHGEAARNLIEGRGFVIDQAYIGELVAKSGSPPYLIDLEDVKPPENEVFSDVYIITPGPASLLAFTYWVFGEYRYIYARILQSLIDAFGCLIIFLLGRKVFNNRVGLISASIYALFLPLAYSSATITHDALMPFLLLTSLYLFVKGAFDISWKYFALSAIAIGISCYFQPSAIFLPFVYGLAYAIFIIHRLGLWERIWRATKTTILMVLIVAMITMPWIIRNHQITGMWSPNMRVMSWSTIWTGMGEFPDNPLGAKLSSEYALAIAYGELYYAVEFSSIKFEEVFKPKVISLITDYPEWTIKAVLSRIPRTIFYVNALGIEEIVPKGVSLAEFNTVSWHDYIPALQNGTLIDVIKKAPYTAFCWGMVALFAYIPPLTALGGIIVSRKWRILALLLTVPFYLSLVHMASLVTAAGKSLLPGAPVFILLSAVFIEFYYRKLEPN